MDIANAKSRLAVLPKDELGILEYLVGSGHAPVKDIYMHSDTKEPLDYYINDLKNLGLLKPLHVGSNGNGEEVRITALGNDILRLYKNKSSVSEKDINLIDFFARDPSICLSLDDITPAIEDSLINDAYHGDYGGLSDDLKTHFSTLNDIYYKLYNAQLIISIASGNTERLVGAALERYFQLGYEIRDTRTAPPLDEIVGKKSVLLAASGSGSKYVAADLERFFEAVDKYDLWDFVDRNVSVIGISAGLETPIKRWCDDYLVLSGNTKESAGNNTNPNKVMGDVFEAKAGATIAIGWKKTKAQKGITEDQMKRRHKVWA